MRLPFPRYDDDFLTPLLLHVYGLAFSLSRCNVATPEERRRRPSRRFRGARARSPRAGGAGSEVREPTAGSPTLPTDP